MCFGLEEFYYLLDCGCWMVMIDNNYVCYLNLMFGWCKIFCLVILFLYGYIIYIYIVVFIILCFIVWYLYMYLNNYIVSIFGVVSNRKWNFE